MSFIYLGDNEWSGSGDLNDPNDFGGLALYPGGGAGFTGGGTLQGDGAFFPNVGFAGGDYAMVGSFDISTIEVGSAGVPTVNYAAAVVTMGSGATVDANIAIGWSSQGNELIIEDGATVSTEISIGQVAGGGGGLIVQTGATVSAISIALANVASASAWGFFDDASVEVGGYIDVGAAGSGSLTVQDSAIVSAGGFTIGNQSTGSGGFLFQTGANVSTGILEMGQQTSAVGSGIIDGATVSVNGFVNVGDAGSGQLTIEGNAIVSAGGFAIGNQSTGSGGLTIQAGANVSAGSFDIANQASAIGSIVIDGATVNISSYFNVGDAGSGQLTVQDKAVVSAGSFTIGNQSAGSGSVVIDSATVNVINDFNVGDAGTGQLTIKDGASVSANGFDIAGQQSGSGGLLIDGATVHAGGYVTVGDAGSGQLTIRDGAQVSAGDFDVANQSGSTGALKIQTSATVSAGSFDIGYQISASGSVVVDSGAVSAGFITVGDGGSGQFTIQDGAQVSAGGFNIGAQSSGSGSVVVDSATVSGGFITVGDAGSGQLTIRDGAQVSAGGFDLGAQPSASGSVVVDSATESGAFITVGDGGSGQFTIQDGAQVSASGFNIGAQSSGSGGVVVDSATVNVDSGFITVGNGGSGQLTIRNGAQVSAGGLTLGYQSGSFGSLTISGSDTYFKVPNGDATSGTFIGYQGSGSLLITDEATFDPGSFIVLGAVAGGAGELDIDQGISVETNNIGIGGTYAGSGGSGTVNVAQGGIVTADQTIGLFTGAINVANGGSVDIGTNTDAIAGAVHVGADGTLAQLPGTGTISGNLVDDGNVSVSGTLNATGSTTINVGGTLTVYDGGSVIGTIADNGSSTGGLVFNVSGTDTFNGTLTGSGSLTVEGGGTLVLSGGDAFTGNITITGGSTLELTSATAAGSGSITFSGTNNTLQVDGTTMPTNVISGFVPGGDDIDLPNVQFDYNGYWVFQPFLGPAPDILTVVENGLPYEFNLDSSQPFSGAFSLSSEDDGTGTEISVTSGAAVAAPPNSPIASSNYSYVPSASALAQNPYSGVVQLTVNFSDGTDNGSGFVIGNHWILTAAHVLDGDGNGAPLQVSISFVGSAGQQLILKSSQFDANPNFDGFSSLSPPDPTTDFGVIYVSQDLSSFGLTQFEIQAAPPGVGTYNLTGFPAAITGEQETLVGQASASQGAFTSTNLLSEEGQSGGPIWTFNGTNYVAVGLVSNAVTGDLAFTNDPATGNLQQIEGLENSLSPPCYVRGTLIITERGEVPVEDLTIGAKVITASGVRQPIKWIGKRRYSGRFVMGRRDILPICIKAGALDADMPRRDLWISPNHAMFLDGVLIEAKDLINGVSIVQAESVESIEYFHVELDSHDVLVAEGAPSESFIDDDSRFIFHNAHEYRALYPVAATSLGQYCAPRLRDGYAVEAIRRRIALRAGLAPRIAPTSAGPLRGFVDRISSHVVEGWAQNIDHTEAPICLDIFSSGRLIGQVLANGYRHDLEQAGVGTGCHSFHFTAPTGIVLIPDEVDVRRSLDGALLTRPAHPQHSERLSTAA